MTVLVPIALFSISVIGWLVFPTDLFVRLPVVPGVMTTMWSHQFCQQLHLDTSWDRARDWDTWCLSQLLLLLYCYYITAITIETEYVVLEHHVIISVRPLNRTLIGY